MSVALRLRPPSGFRQQGQGVLDEQVERVEEVRVAKGKGNKERVVPMGLKLRRSLRRHLRSR